MIIYITGIDGSGKSSITQKLKEDVFPKNTITVWARYTPSLVKTLIRPFKRKFVKDVKRGYLMDAKEYQRWSGYKKVVARSFVLKRCIYLLQALDYFLQLRKYSRHLEKKEGRDTIIDRYLLDFIVDQSVNYGDISKAWITRLCLHKLNSLDFIFFIDVDEETAFSRKDDIPSLLYLQQRRKYYKEYISRLTNAYVIENNGDLITAVHKIEKILPIVQSSICA